VRKRIGRGRQPAAKFNPPATKVESEAETVCSLCGEPIKGVKGAKVYHWQCLYDSMKEVREKTTPPA
jgi:hypothetical protein